MRLGAKTLLRFETDWTFSIQYYVDSSSTPMSSSARHYLAFVRQKSTWITASLVLASNEPVAFFGAEQRAGLLNGTESVMVFRGMGLLYTLI
jgi:hypothetical protein